MFKALKSCLKKSSNAIDDQIVCGMRHTREQQIGLLYYISFKIIFYQGLTKPS